MKLKEIDVFSSNINTTDFFYKTLFIRYIKDHEYESVLTSIDTTEPPPYPDKWKYEIMKIGTHLEIERRKHSMSRYKMTQKIDPYNLYYGFDNDDFEGQGMGYDDNDFRVVS